VTGPDPLSSFKRALKLGLEPSRARELSVRVAEGLAAAGRPEQALEALDLAASLERRFGSRRRLQDELLRRLRASGRFLDPRRFHSFGVGLGRTGTKSLAGLLSNWRSRHEYRQREVLSKVVAWSSGRLDREGLRAYLLRRDRRDLLEMDSSSDHSYWAEQLVAAFPRAKFVLLVRDCPSWIDSSLNRVLDDGDGAGDEARRRAGADLFAAVSERVLEWVRMNEQLLSRLPSDRSLLLRTHELSARQADLAAFLGIPAASLAPERSHLNGSRRDYRVLARLDAKRIGRAFAPARALMARLFPDRPLSAYLEARRGPR
jgi:hypothetical protein